MQTFSQLYLKAWKMTPGKVNKINFKNWLLIVVFVPLIRHNIIHIWHNQREGEKEGREEQRERRERERVVD